MSTFKNRVSRRRYRVAFTSTRSRAARCAPYLELLEPRVVLSSGPYFVTVTDDSTAAGTLRSAILAADQDTDPNPFDIEFAIPASTAPELNVPVSGFNPNTQTWTITLNSALPAITHAVVIDGFSEANTGVPFRYTDELVSAVQDVEVNGLPSGGTYTLTTAAPLPAGTTAPIPYNATAAQVQNALALLVGNANVTATQLGAGLAAVTFQGAYSGMAIPNLVADYSGLTGGTTPSVTIIPTTAGSLNTPTYITSVPNTVAAIDGDNAQVRVIIDGSNTSGSTGFVLDASDSIIRGLAVEGFGVGISIPDPTNVGDSIQGNFIGPYLAYPVDQGTGDPLPAPDDVILAGERNTQEGIMLGSANATIGGFNPDENNVISGNGAQGVLLVPGTSGNQVLGNQIGVIGPSTNGLYFQLGNGADGVLIESTGMADDPAGIV